jgi:hypothetical protein
MKSIVIICLFIFSVFFGIKSSPNNPINLPPISNGNEPNRTIQTPTPSSLPLSILTNTQIPNKVNVRPTHTPKVLPTRTMHPTLTPYVIVHPLENKDINPLIILSILMITIIILGILINRRNFQ